MTSKWRLNPPPTNGYLVLSRRNACHIIQPMYRADNYEYSVTYIALKSIKGSA